MAERIDTSDTTGLGSKKGPGAPYERPPHEFLEIDPDREGGDGSAGSSYIDDFLATLEGVDMDALLGLSEGDVGLPGGGGGGGGTSRRGGSAQGGSGGGGGGRGVGDDALVRQLMGLVSEDVEGGDLLTADPELRDQLLGIVGSLEDQRGKLVDLDKQTEQDLEAQTEAERLLFERQVEDAKADLLTRLFGNRAQRTTVAGDVGERLVSGSALGRAQIEAGGAERRLGLRTALTEQSLTNLASQANLVLGQQAQDLSDRQLEFQQLDAVRNLRATLLDSALGRRSDILRTRIDANSRVKAASIDANSRVKVARIDASTDRYGINVGARSRLTSDLLGAFGEGERLGQESRQFDLDLDLRRYLGTENVRLQEKQLGIEQQRLRSERRANDLATLASLAQTAATIYAASDPDLKTDVEPLEDATRIVRGIRGRRWNWRPGLEDLPQAPVGVMADEVEAVLPEAVRRGRLGVRVVDLSALVGVLAAALNEALDRIDKLESD